MRIYFMGICGTAMGNAALLVKEQGHEVMGSDEGIYPPMCDVLAGSGIEVLEGFDAERLARLKPDRVVVGNAMSRGNAEVEWLLDQVEVPYYSLPALLHDTVLKGRRPIVVAGTHGKTTTSTLVAFLLDEAGEDPGWLVGGVPNDLPGGAKLGRADAFVIEGDEYDSAFFDKRSKFIHYRPHIAVLNNLEFDHGDIFRDLEDVMRSFRHFLRIVPRSGYVLLNGDDRNLKQLLPVPWTRVLTVGLDPSCDCVIEDFSDSPAGASFSLTWRGQPWSRVSWGMHGVFNARNAAMAALAAALGSGQSDPRSFDLSALAGFGGVRRRQDVLHTNGKWTVLEDFAHHPTAIAGAIEALRAAYPGMPMTVCFEPRSNTAVTSRFQAEFTAAFGAADRVYLGPLYRAERLNGEDRLDTARIAEALPAGIAFDCHKDIFVQLERDLRAGAGGLIVFFTNGGFEGLPRRIAALAAEF